MNGRPCADGLSFPGSFDTAPTCADLTASTANVTGYPINDTASRFDAADIVVS